MDNHDLYSFLTASERRAATHYAFEANNIRNPPYIRELNHAELNKLLKAATLRAAVVLENGPTIEQQEKWARDIYRKTDPLSYLEPPTSADLIQMTAEDFERAQKNPQSPPPVRNEVTPLRKMSAAEQLFGEAPGKKTVSEQRHDKEIADAKKAVKVCTGDTDLETILEVKSESQGGVDPLVYYEEFTCACGYFWKGDWRRVSDRHRPTTQEAVQQAWDAFFKHKYTEANAEGVKFDQVWNECYPTEEKKKNKSRKDKTLKFHTDKTTVFSLTATIVIMALYVMFLLLNLHVIPIPDWL